MQAISWKVVTTANSKRQSPFDCFEIVVDDTLLWDVATGAHSVTVEVITDNIVLTNADLWVEVEYLGSASTPIASVATSAPARPSSPPAPT